jgi:hypothetical protein
MNTACCYVEGGKLAAIAREQLWRDVTGFLAFHLFMVTPLRLLPWKFVLWLAPAIGDWSERNARWTFAVESAFPLQTQSEKGSDRE